MRSKRLSLVVGYALLGAACSVLWGCASDAGETVVGSGKVEELSTDSMFVERVTISLPFKTLVYNGDPRKLTVRGENNLIPYIDVSEVSVGKWEITAPSDLHFEQHQDIELKIPYIDMVEIGVDGDSVEFVDDPAKVWAGDG